MMVLPIPENKPLFCCYWVLLWVNGLDDVAADLDDGEDERDLPPNEFLLEPPYLLGMFDDVIIIQVSSVHTYTPTW